MHHKNSLSFGCATLLLALVFTSPAADAASARQWFPYPYPIFGLPGPRPFGDHYSSVRLQVTPRDALVYVDGYAAGVVDDFDGVFQRLQLVPGHHEIVVYLQGHRTFRQNLYLSPGSSHTIRHTMDQLSSGEAGEPQPVPLRPPIQARGIPPWQGAPSQQASGVGMLWLRLQPADATVIIDGEPWRGPRSQDRLMIPLPEGTHQIRVEKGGFQGFAVEVEIKPDETTTFNVTLVAE